MGYFPAKEVQPGLWIGSEGDSQNPDFMTAHDIGLIVNCTKNIPFLDMPGVDTYRIPIDDSPSNGDIILSHFPVVVRAIDSVLQRGKGVLVHCRAGMQRSAATVAAYIMYKYGVSAKNAMNSIKSQKSETFWPVATFANALAKYETQLAAFNATKSLNNTTSLRNNANSLMAPSTPRRRNY
jgi:protein tyrosine phosphatase